MMNTGFHRFLRCLPLSRHGWTLALLLAVAAATRADVRLPAVVSDHMVLQRGQPVRIWGWADAGEQVSVVFRHHHLTATAGSDGRWEVFLPPLYAAGPDEMEIRGNNTISLRDILVGEVWVGSGQSNMVWPVSRSNGAPQEIAAADYPQIRLFQVKLTVANERREDVEGSWKVCSPQTVGDFSAVGYFFARELHRELGVPLGVVQSAWGGTPAEAWTPRKTLETDPALSGFLKEWREVLGAYPQAKRQYERELAQWEAAAATARQQGKEPPARPRAPRGPGHQHTPAGLFNAMIAPLTPMAIRGVIWYQGENNANRGHGYVYRHLFKTMILDWRREWALGNFPFLFVQLANYARVPADSQWPEVREAQAMALHLRNTGMAVTIDIGESTDIHPRNKQDVGHRLALAARATAYGQEVAHSGPTYRQMTTEGGRIRLWFDHAAGGLMSQGSALNGFEVADSDGRFVSATATIEGDTVLVSAPSVAAPAHARYAWGNDPQGNLYNRSGLPAGPFRTEFWWGE